MRLLLMLLLVTVTPWWWQVFSFNKVLFVILLLLSLFLVDNYKRLRGWYLVVAAIGLLVCFLITPRSSLTVSSNSQVSTNSRWQHYPIGTIKLGKFDVIEKIAIWFEVNPTSFKIKSWQDNLLLLIDPNYYFFANHPRERVGMIEKERFAWVLLPIVMVGLFSLARYKEIIVLFLAVILVSSIYWHGELGPTLMIPFLCLFIVTGVDELFRALSKYVKNN